MLYTNTKLLLDQLYTDMHLNLDNGDLLEIPTFTHNDCRITVNYLPACENDSFFTMTVRIVTNNDVIFTPFYLKATDKNEFEFIPYFDDNEYKAIKEPIIKADNYSTIPLFNDISEHIQNCNLTDLIRQPRNIWSQYKRQRTINPSISNDNILPKTLKKVRIGELSKNRIFRILPYSEANNVIHALYNSNMTIVFTSDPSAAKGIYALLETFNIVLPRLQ